MSQPLLVAKNVVKIYTIGAGIQLEVLKRASLQVARGEFVAIVGSSGSGKSTLLHILGALDVPNSGEVFYDSSNVFDLTARQRDELRCRTFGFVFQFYHLLPELTVLENALLPQMILYSALQWPGRAPEARAKCLHILERVGLAHRLKHRPDQLSGGERQRLAIARALTNSPPVLLADEPTGNLDRKTGLALLDLLGELHQRGQTIVMVTHDPEVARAADRVLRLEEGRLSAGS